MFSNIFYSNDYRTGEIYRNTDNYSVYWYKVVSQRPSTRFNGYIRNEAELIKRCDHHERYCDESCAPEGYDCSNHPISMRPYAERRKFFSNV